MPRSASSSKSISTHRSWKGSSTAFSMCLLISQRRSVVAPEQFGICSNPISLDNLPGINQGREVEADHIHLQFGAIVASARVLASWPWFLFSDRTYPYYNELHLSA
jgi:hypothetical protein